MTLSLAIPTFVGGFIFAFMLRFVWTGLCNHFGSFGTWMAGASVVGLCWALNHHVGLIYQTGAWIDMAWAASSGLFAASIIYDKAHIVKGLINAFYAIIGGLIAGFVLSCMG